MADQVTIMRCLCGYPRCADFWLEGAGKFVQGSGFPQQEAQDIADFLNARTRQDVDRLIARRALAGSAGNISAACRELGIGRTTFYRWMKAGDA